MTTTAEATPPPGFHFDDPTQRLIIAVLQCTITAIGVPGNILVILLVTLSKRLQTRTNFFIVNLAFADLLTCLMLPFQAFAVLHDTLPFPNLLCEAVATLMWLGVGASIISLALIALVRLFVITRPRQTFTQVFRKRNLFLMVFFAWLFPFILIFVPPRFGFGEIGYSEKYRFCMTDSNIQSHDLYSMFNGIIIPIPCFLVIIICYSKIYLFVRKVSLDVVVLANCGPCEVRTPTSPRTTLEIALFRRQVKVAKNLFIVICAFMLCVMPLGVNCSLPSQTYPAIPWTFTFFCLNCCINPLIYGLKHPQFQEVLWLHLSRSWRKRSAERQPLIQT